MTSNKKTLDDLISELEGSAPDAKGPRHGKPPGGQTRLPDAAYPSFGGRWLLGVALLALGFGGGWIAAGLRPPANASAGTKLAKETRQHLLADGWQESDQGVFTRRCQDNCRRPVLYGGGVADVMEVNCLERPCGTIQAKFVVVDRRSQVIGQIMESRNGLQGERLQIVIESPLPDAHRFVLQSFRAKARLD